MKSSLSKRLFLSARLLWRSAVVSLLILLSGCNDDDECFESECYNAPRFCVEIIPYNNQVDICEQVSAEYLMNTYDEYEEVGNCGIGIGFPDSFNRKPTYSIWPGPEPDSLDVTITHNEQSAAKHVELAEFNRCGRDIAYVIATLHEDGPPTFGEVVYISPCEQGSL